MNVQKLVKVALQIWRVLSILCAAQQQLATVSAVRGLGTKVESLHEQISRLQVKAVENCDDAEQMQSAQS